MIEQSLVGITVRWSRCDKVGRGKTEERMTAAARIRLKTATDRTKLCLKGLPLV